MSKGYYKRLDKGKYLCPHCGTVYDSPFACHEAKQCCPDLKLIDYDVVGHAEGIAYRHIHPKEKEIRPRTALPGDGVKHPDKHGHWYRGTAVNPAFVEADYHHAQLNIEKQIRKEEIERLENIYPSYELKTRRRSPLQCMAYAYYLHDWDSLKAAAIAMANEYADRVLKRHLQTRYDEIDQICREFEDGQKGI